MLLDDIADYLSSGGLGTVGTDIYKGFMPETPNIVLTVYETGGQEPSRGMAASPGQMQNERPRVQVVVRCSEYDYQTARTKLNDAFRLLDGFGDRDINGVRYKWIGAIHSPALMGRDEQGRVKLVCNFDVVKALSTA